jgi:hypothetical protein
MADKLKLLSLKKVYFNINYRKWISRCLPRFCQILANIHKNQNAFTSNLHCQL